MWTPTLDHISERTKRSDYVGKSPRPLSLAESKSLYAIRGIAIVFVVIAHVGAHANWPTDLLAAGMPLFFFLSGYVYFSPDDQKGYQVHIFRKLIIPYFAYLLCFSMPQAIIDILSGNPELVYDRTLWLLMGGEKIAGSYTAFWFPTCFFFTLFIYNVLERRLSAPALSLAMVISLGLATVNQIFSDVWWPLSLNIVAFSLPVLHLGHCYRTRELSKLADDRLHFFAAFFALSYTIFALAGILPGLDMKYAAYGIPVITLLATVCFVILIKQLFDYLQPLTTMNLVLAQLGKASLTIMFVHQPIQLHLYYTLGWQDPWLRIALAVVVSYLAYALFMRQRLLRAIFLGK